MYVVSMRILVDLPTRIYRDDDRVHCCVLAEVQWRPGMLQFREARLNAGTLSL